LDSKSEQTVVDALKRAMKYCKSMIMVTHRLGVIRSLDVNRVLVLEQGEIVEEGHPEDLLRNEKSQYASLAREQGITFGGTAAAAGVTAAHLSSGDSSKQIDHYSHAPATIANTTASDPSSSSDTLDTQQ
jgi:ABC-type glutathione transport system ATPase component